MNKAYEDRLRRRGQEDRMSRMATGAIVVNTNPVAGTVYYRGPRGGSATPVSHPYMGPTSWFRVQPERGTKVLISYRGENLEPYVSAYVAEDINGDAVGKLHDATDSGKFWFRTLKEGELEVTSSGNAASAWLANGNSEHRGGAVVLTLSNTDLEARVDAPVHRHMTLGSSMQSIGNEHRFGVVTRPSPIDRTQKTAVKINDEFAKEYLRHLSYPGQRTPLVDVREGFVIDDNGLPVLANGAKLRYRAQYGTVSEQKVVVTMDETGNVNVVIPQCDTGFVLKTVAANIKLDSGKDLSVLVNQNALVSARKVQVNADRIELAGTQQLATAGFVGTLNAAAAIPFAPPGPAPAIATVVNLIVAYLQTMAAGYNGSLTVKTLAG